MAMFSSPPTAGSAAALVKSRRGRSDLQINPVIRSFYAGFHEFKYSSGIIVTQGTPLHQRRDGAVLTGLKLRKNDTSALVVPVKFKAPNEKTDELFSSIQPSEVTLGSPNVSLPNED